MDLLKQQAELNPPGTKILIEVEIVNQDGHNGLTGLMFNHEQREAFQKISGCSITKIYNKGVTTTHDLETLPIDAMLAIVSEKVKILREQGVQI